MLECEAFLSHAEGVPRGESVKCRSEATYVDDSDANDMVRSCAIHVARNPWRPWKPIGRSMSRARFIAVEGPDGSGKGEQVRRLVERFKGLGYDHVTDPAHVLFQGERPCVLTTREPSDGPIGKLIRSVLVGAVTPAPPDQSMAYLYAADRREHVAAVVEPAIETGEKAGVVVITDRYSLSNVVYRAAEAPGPLLICPQCGWEGEPGARGEAWGSTHGGRTCPKCDTSLNFSAAVRELALRAWALDAGVREPDLTLILAVSPWVASERRRKRGGQPERYEVEALQTRCCVLYREAQRLGRPKNIAVIDGSYSEEEVSEETWAAVREKGLPVGHAAL